ncbi:unnamed protein product [Rotaria sp. Silwood2]|nr:unnamed protein product [Rotaria sp. Silwood2]CAF4273461.1 unnamed protein product [Rotaria sp. Silwood2]CAF4533858.1 unnamed protein product [Rotaria sp. Silwood2]
MPRDTTFSIKWLQKTDSTGKPCSIWLRQGKEKSTFICTVCNIELSCANGGWTNVKNHSERPKHLQCLKEVLESGQLIASTTKLPFINDNNTENQSSNASSSTTTNNSTFIVLNSNTDRALTHDEKVLRAECYWAMATAQLGFSYAASQDIPELFAAMFPDSKVAADYAMKDRKVSYILSHGTGYFFARELVKDVLKAPAYSLLFDETTIVGVRKQLDLHLRYWSEHKQCVVTRYWKSIMLGHATADIISQHLLDSLKSDGIDLSNLFQLGRDNPNVNKAVENTVEKEVRSERGKKTGHVSNKGLVSIGPCPLHIIHNAFKQGFTQNDWQIEEILYDFWFFFSRSSARREDYLNLVKTIGDGVGRFMKRFVITRWIEVGPVIERVIDQWPILTEYFLVYLPKINKKIIDDDRWKRIKKQLEQKQTLVHFHFILYVYRHIFSKPLTWLQQQQPLVHMLFDECSNLLKNVLNSFIKDDLSTNKTVQQLLSISFDSQANQKPDSKLAIGEVTRNVFNEMATNEKNMFLKDVRDIYIIISRELARTLPLTNNFLRNLQFINPLLRHHESSHDSLMIVARDLPQLFSNNDLDQLNAEWRLYENETIPDDWYLQKSINGDHYEVIKYHPVDHYWKHVFNIKNNLGVPKFVMLSKLIKSLLALSHGNADVERGFSENAALVTDNRSSLSETSVNGLRITKDAVKFYGQGKVHDATNAVPICKSLLDNVKEAYSRYRIDQEKIQKLIKEKEELETAAKLLKTQELLLVEKEQKLIDERKLLQHELNNASKMLDEGNSRLEAAVATKNFDNVEVAQLLIGGANKKLDVLRAQLSNNSDQLNQLRKKMKK